MILFKHFTFDSAHYLPNVPLGHKCEEIHGHTYKLTIFIEGPVDAISGWVMDFGTISIILKRTIEKVDHKMLNSVPGLNNPTSEILAKWFWNEIIKDIPGLSKIELYETPTAGVIYEGT